jgi:hypothetical protein
MQTYHVPAGILREWSEPPKAGSDGVVAICDFSVFSAKNYVGQPTKSGTQGFSICLNLVKGQKLWGVAFGRMPYQEPGSGGRKPLLHRWDTGMQQ